MATVTGTATNNADLYSKLLDFLQNNADLVADGQNWDVAWSAPGGAPNTSDIVLRGPGLSSSDQVFVGFRRNDDVVGDSYITWLRGMTGVLSGASEYSGHVNVGQRVGIYGDKDPMTYWFIANGRRFIVIVKISTVYQMAYAGLFLPYGTPLTYPYPLIVGGSRGDVQDLVQNWRSVSQGHTHFVYPYFTITGVTISNDSQAWMLDPIGQWIRARSEGDPYNGTDPAVLIGPEYMGTGLGISADGASNNFGYRVQRLRMREGYGGDYALLPFTLTQQSPDDQTWGILDGIYSVSGFGNSTENVITVDGVDYLVVQNTFRTGIGDFIAVALE